MKGGHFTFKEKEFNMAVIYLNTFNNPHETYSFCLLNEKQNSDQNLIF